jgi:hypothetical protein
MRWFSLAKAQALLGIEGSRGKRLRTILRRYERDHKTTYIRETAMPSGRIRCEVSEITLISLFPRRFERDHGLQRFQEGIEDIKLEIAHLRRQIAYERDDMERRSETRLRVPRRVPDDVTPGSGGKPPGGRKAG